LKKTTDYTKNTYKIKHNRAFFIFTKINYVKLRNRFRYSYRE